MDQVLRLASCAASVRLPQEMSAKGKPHDSGRPASTKPSRPGEFGELWRGRPRAGVLIFICNQPLVFASTGKDPRDCYW